VGLTTLVEGQTFCVADGSGDMRPDFPHGLFVLDTRVVSQWVMRVNDQLIETLAVDRGAPFDTTFVGRAHPPPGRADSEVVVRRQRSIGAGMRERIELTNYGTTPAPMRIDLHCDVDFADLFEVKERRVRTHGTRWCTPTGTALEYGFRDATVAAKTVRIASDGPVTAAPGLLSWAVMLEPRGRWEACVEVRITIGGEPLAPRFRCTGDDAAAEPNTRLASWRAALPRVVTTHGGLAATLRRSGEDLGALRIVDPAHPDVPILAAGAPWFMTVFGRDSLLTAWMALLADPRLARGALQTLARFQGDTVDPSTEEEPGKILHEMRFGSSARAALGAASVYFGSVDATPLFVMLLGELRRWDLADDLVPTLLPHADRALAWIRDFGDRDGDGYVEYERRNDQGLANQGWKDSWDAISFADGSLARAPIALCEVQGYVYAAYVARAHLAHDAGDRATYVHYRDRARDLRRRFNEDFWLDGPGWFAMGLDAEKRPIDALASNMGHCLWTGIVEPERAAVVAEHLTAPPLFSGWGIRTLAATMGAFNPVGYHAGSVWPHDNALAIAGLVRYGFVEEAHRVLAAQLDVAAAHGGRLPELFAGFTRGAPAVPAAYPTSCSPQAWAAASPLLWLRSLLRIDPWAARGEVRIDPALPEWIPHLQVEGIRVAGESLAVDVADGRFDVSGAGRLDVLATASDPGPPWARLDGPGG